MDLLFRRNAAVKLAEIDKLFAENIAVQARTAIASRRLKVASDESNERLREIRTEIEQKNVQERITTSEPRTGDVLRLARSALERVQKH